MSRLVQEASNEGCARLVAGGGDGTINEVVDALLTLPADVRPELAVLPLGTANDFATGCLIPVEPLAALKLAQSGQACLIDAVKANEFHFINVASGGFGAQVTATTPVALKNFLGGGAYTVTGLVQALSFTPFHGEVHLPEGKFEDNVIVGAVCNGRQAGGGQQLAPSAMLDDGLVDIVALTDFPAKDISQVIQELMETELSGEYVKRFRVPWVEWRSEEDIPINLDGEPISAKQIRYEVLPNAIKMVLPENCPMVTSCS
jgi:lipid kinase YegS